MLCGVALQVHVEYLPSGTRTMTVKGLDAKSAGSFSFKPKGGVAITVEAYFQQAYGIKLQHPDWPCVMVSKTAAIPMELCT
jgi:eukaryotic translation initiation factor 2C